MKARNLRTGAELSNNIDLADDLFNRMKGLLGKCEMGKGDSLWIKHCMSIHTFFMRFSIDVIFMNKKNQVVAVRKNLKPYRVTCLYPKATSVLELPAGTIEATSTEVGDEIEFF